MNGAWAEDLEGRPTYVVAGAPPVATGPPGVDPWHLVGSPGLLALAHLSGRTSLFVTASGMARLAERSGRWTVDGEEPAVTSVTFGGGWAQWEGTVDGARVRRRIDADEELPLLRIRWEVECERPVTLGESWTIRHHPLVVGGLMARRVPPPSTHRGLARVAWVVAFTASDVLRRATDALRAGLGRRYPVAPRLAADGRSVRWEPVRRPRPPRRPVLFRRDLPTLELRSRAPSAVASGDGVEVAVDPRGEVGPTVVELELRLHPAGPRIAKESPARAARPQRIADAAPGAGPDEVGERVRSAPAPLVAEARWHVAQLRGLRVPDAWTGHTFVMQGSAYAFVHGLHGAPRDEALVAVPLAVLDPPVARAAVLAIAAMVAPDGSLHYSRSGYGRTLSVGVHAAPTDLPLFFLWALTEYVWATGDRALLEERPHPFGRRVAGTDDRPTVATLASSSLRWLDDEVGIGEHGLLRVGSGDWADPIALMVRRSRTFHHRGESTFNAGMACYVLDRFAAMVNADDAASSARARALAEQQRTALEGAWTGRWFLRGWDGRGGAIGEHHCFLDAQVWPLIAGVGGAARGAAVVDAIGRLLDDPSPIGPTILDRPHRVRFGLLADGWDCNGGVWAALGGLAAWGVAQHDRPRAWRMLEKMSLAGQAAAYPEHWFGRWSGPDARNAWFGDRPGDTFVHPATPMTEFPTMNSNAHAGPLLGLLRVAGTTVTEHGVSVAP